MTLDRVSCAAPLGESGGVSLVVVYTQMAVCERAQREAPKHFLPQRWTVLAGRRFVVGDVFGAECGEAKEDARLLRPVVTQLLHPRDPDDSRQLEAIVRDRRVTEEVGLEAVDDLLGARGRIAPLVVVAVRDHAFRGADARLPRARRLRRIVPTLANEPCCCAVALEARPRRPRAARRDADGKEPEEPAHDMDCMPSA